MTRGHILTAATMIAALPDEPTATVNEHGNVDIVHNGAVCLRLNNLRCAYQLAYRLCEAADAAARRNRGEM